MCGTIMCQARHDPRDPLPCPSTGPGGIPQFKSHWWATVISNYNYCIGIVLSLSLSLYIIRIITVWSYSSQCCSSKVWVRVSEDDERENNHNAGQFVFILWEKRGKLILTTTTKATAAAGEASTIFFFFMLSTLPYDGGKKASGKYTGGRRW